MNVFVINSGSSSIKYQLIQMPEAVVVCSGLVDRIGLEGSTVQHKTFLKGTEQVTKKELPVKDHAEGLTAVAKLLTHAEIGVIKNPEEIHAVGHRVVHGGET